MKKIPISIIRSELSSLDKLQGTTAYYYLRPVERAVAHPLRRLPSSSTEATPLVIRDKRREWYHCMVDVMSMLRPYQGKYPKADTAEMLENPRHIHTEMLNSGITWVRVSHIRKAQCLLGKGSG